MPATTALAAAQAAAVSPASQGLPTVFIPGGGNPPGKAPPERPPAARQCPFSSPPPPSAQDLKLRPAM
eukprot:8357601-Lingulodinium_polyedra.AAC.1